MSSVPPFEVLYDAEPGQPIPLPDALRSIYGPLFLPTPSGRPYVIANFVSTIDGVVSLAPPGSSKSAGDISGSNRHDHFVMGLLRAVADAVVVGASTLRSAPRHLWLADFIFPPLADSYQQLRESLGKSEPPLTVFVTDRGEIDPSLAAFEGKTQVLIITNPQGAERLRERGMPASVEIAAVEAANGITPQSMLEAITRIRPSDVVLVEGGPHLLSSFFAARRLDEQFLTIAPQVAGRTSELPRLGLVAGELFAPERPIWGTLESVRRADSHLFLRYAFPVA